MRPQSAKESARTLPRKWIEENWDTTVADSRGPAGRQGRLRPRSAVTRRKEKFVYNTYTGHRISPREQRQQQQQQQQQQRSLPHRPVVKGMLSENTLGVLSNSWGRGGGPIFARKGLGPQVEPPRPPKGPTKPQWPTLSLEASVLRYVEAVRREKLLQGRQFPRGDPGGESSAVEDKSKEPQLRARDVAGAWGAHDVPTVPWPEHAVMEKGDVVVTVEYCHGCYSHRMTTRHDPEAYLRHANAVKELLVDSLREAPVRLAVVLKKSQNLSKGGGGGGNKRGGVSTVRQRRVGAFEVQVAARHPSRAHRIYALVVHSKLVSGRWPKLGAGAHLPTRVKATLASWGFASTRRSVDDLRTSLDDTANEILSESCCRAAAEGTGSDTSVVQHRHKPRIRISWEFDHREWLKPEATPDTTNADMEVDRHCKSDNSGGGAAANEIGVSSDNDAETQKNNDDHRNSGRRDCKYHNDNGDGDDDDNNELGSNVPTSASNGATTPNEPQLGETENVQHVGAADTSYTSPDDAGFLRPRGLSDGVAEGFRINRDPTLEANVDDGVSHSERTSKDTDCLVVDDGRRTRAHQDDRDDVAIALVATNSSRGGRGSAGGDQSEGDVTTTAGARENVSKRPPSSHESETKGGAYENQQCRHEYGDDFDSLECDEPAASVRSSDGVETLDDLVGDNGRKDHHGEGNATDLGGDVPDGVFNPAQSSQVRGKQRATSQAERGGGHQLHERTRAANNLPGSRSSDECDVGSSEPRDAKLDVQEEPISEGPDSAFEWVSGTATIKNEEQQGQQKQEQETDATTIVSRGNEITEEDAPSRNSKADDHDHGYHADNQHLDLCGNIQRDEHASDANDGDADDGCRYEDVSGDADDAITRSRTVGEQYEPTGQTNASYGRGNRQREGEAANDDPFQAERLEPALAAADEEYGSDFAPQEDDSVVEEVAEDAAYLPDEESPVIQEQSYSSIQEDGDGLEAPDGHKVSGAEEDKDEAEDEEEDDDYEEDWVEEEYGDDFDDADGD